MYDVLIRNGKIIDGTGNPWFYGDIGIRGDKIADVGELCIESGNVTIDAQGLVVAPGFIDMHTHTELAYYEHPDASFKISQGVTTELGGQCALSPAPVSDKTRDEIRSVNNPLCGLGDLEYSWNTMEEFFQVMETRPHVNHLALLTGHNAIRTCVMGFEDRAPTDRELDEMKSLLKESIDAGAYGLSSAGVQSPSNFAETEEMIELCRVVAAQKGLYEGHMRSESNNVLESIGEMLLIARKTGVRTQISHYKIAGRKNWGKAGAGLALMREARENGIDVACNQYPYTYASFNLEALLPTWARSGTLQQIQKRLASAGIRRRIEHDMIYGIPDSGWESVYQWCGYDGITIGSVNRDRNRGLEGKTISEIAHMQNQTEIDVICDLIMSDGLGILMLPEFGNEEEVEEILAFPWTSPVTDALPTHLQGGGNHPRIFGTFPKVLGHYVRERGCISLEEAIRKMTSLPASRIGLKKRGLLKEGYYADLVLFHPDVVADRAASEHPQELADGIEQVYVDGVLAYQNKKVTGDLAGQYLRRGR